MARKHSTPLPPPSPAQQAAAAADLAWRRQALVVLDVLWQARMEADLQALIARKTP